MKTKHFQLTEINSDADNSNIGVIPNVVNSQAGEEAFNVRFMTAVEEHFDLKFKLKCDKLPFNILFEDGFINNIITLVDEDDKEYKVCIQQTWLY